MTILTLITLLVIAYGALGSHGYGRALALGGATAAGVAVSVSGIGVPTFYAVAMGTVVALGFHMLGKGPAPAFSRQSLPPGSTLLLLFLAWSTLVTLLAPELFNGLNVLGPTGPKHLIAAAFTSSNIAQVGYLVLGVCVVIFLARSPSVGPELIGLVVGATTLLSLWRYFHQISGVPFPNGLFDNSPTLAFIETAPGGLHRFRGILSEPAGLAGSSLVTLAYMLPRSFQVHGWRRAGVLFVVGSALYLGVISTSATFVVAGVAVVVVAALTFALGFLMRRTSLSALVSVVACALVIAGLWLLPIVAQFVQSTVNDKVLSPSYSQRSGADAVSYNIFLDTFGFGVGLGSNRSSSFLPGLLSTTGLIGTLLFSAAIVAVIHRSGSIRKYRPVIWALVTLLVAKVVAGPDLSDSSGVLWISLGLLSHAAQSTEAKQAFLRWPRSVGFVPSAVTRRDNL